METDEVIQFVCSTYILLGCLFAAATPVEERDEAAQVIIRVLCWPVIAGAMAVDLFRHYWK